jgi:hypothetical protein
LRCRLGQALFITHRVSMRACVLTVTLPSPRRPLR